VYLNEIAAAGDFEQALRRSYENENLSCPEKDDSVQTLFT